MTELLTKFNDTFVELLDDLIRVFPEDGDFKVAKLGVRTAVMSDEAAVQAIFHEKVTARYEGHVLSRDESFFLQQDYREDTAEFDDAADVVDKLKGYWKHLGEGERDAIWRYLRVLVLLDKRYLAARDAAPR